MLLRFFRKIICAVTLLRVGALRVFIEQLRGSASRISIKE